MSKKMFQDPDRLAELKTMLEGYEGMSPEEYKEYREQCKESLLATLLGLKDVRDDHDQEEFEEVCMKMLVDVLARKRFGAFSATVGMGIMMMLQNPEMSIEDMVDKHNKIQDLAKAIADNKDDEAKVKSLLEETSAVAMNQNYRKTG